MKILFTLQVYTIIFKGIKYRYLSPISNRKAFAKYIGIRPEYISKGASPVLPVLQLNKES